MSICFLTFFVLFCTIIILFSSARPANAKCKARNVPCHCEGRRPVATSCTNRPSLAPAPTGKSFPRARIFPPRPAGALWVATTVGCSVNQQKPVENCGKTPVIHRLPLQILGLQRVFFYFPVDNPVNNVDNFPGKTRRKNRFFNIMSTVFPSASKHPAPLAAMVFS